MSLRSRIPWLRDMTITVSPAAMEEEPSGDYDTALVHQDGDQDARLQAQLSQGVSRFRVVALATNSIASAWPSAIL